MRIVAGKHRGRALTALGKGDKGAHLRPTSDRVRESLFSVLNSRDAIFGARVLDMFSGTGALGLEALSRGASHAVFVDDGRKSLWLLRDNIRLLDEAANSTVIARDATRIPPNSDGACDLVFLDPPYGKGLGTKALSNALKGGWIAPNALIVFEENSPQDPPEGFELIDHRRYGDTYVTLLALA